MYIFTQAQWCVERHTLLTLLIIAAVSDSYVYLNNQTEVAVLVCVFVATEGLNLNITLRGWGMRCHDIK